MIKIQKDFYSNVKSGKVTDNEMFQSIADVIANDKEELKIALQQSGIKVSDKASDKELVGLLSKNLATNNKLVNGVAFLIAKQKDLLLEKKSGLTTGGEDYDPESTTAIIGAIANGLATIFGQPNASQTAAAQINQNLPKKDNTALYIGLAVGAAVLITIAVILTRKK